jgi:hypothetical protein
MNVKILVRTADEVPIVGATVTLNGGSNVITDGAGEATLASTPTADSFMITASITNYVTQNVTVILDNNGVPSWDDPGTIVSGIWGHLTLEIRLGRLMPAPTVDYSDDVLNIPASIFNSFKSPSNPSYVVPMQHTFTNADGQYSFLFATNRNFWAATGQNILSRATSPGWGSFMATATAIDPKIKDHFTWLEWAPPGGSPSSLNRYLVALWRRRSSTLPGSAPRDVIIFYTPNTSDSRGYLPDNPPYRGSYPYALNQSENVRRLTQQYVTLGLRYLFNEKFLAYQMLASARDALLIVPIQPAAKWEVFRLRDGVQRLLTEAILYDHRQRLVPDADSSVLDTAPPRNVRGGISARTVFAKHLPPPVQGTVVTAGFSAGMEAVKNLIISTGTSYTSRSWNDESKNSYFADSTKFIASWREIWDFDGSANVVGSDATWARTLAEWKRADGHEINGVSDRVARCYHTDYTGWDAHRSLNVMNAVIGQPVPSASLSFIQDAGSKTAERHGENGSAVVFNHTYLTGNGPPKDWHENEVVLLDGSKKPPDAPAFWKGIDPPNDIGSNAHQAVPLICLAHAAANSQLRKV